MLNDLPELGDIFSKESNNSNNKVENEVSDEEFEIEDQDINIFISKEENKWLSVAYIDMAPGGIGLHVLLPVEIDIHPDDLNKMHIKFERKNKSSSVVIKEVPVLLRWQERDQISGKVKLGLHFHGDVRSDPLIIEILKKLSHSSKY